MTIPFHRLLSVETRKLFDTRSGKIMTAILMALTLASIIGRGVVSGPHLQTLVGTAGIGLGTLLPVLGILTVTSEWSHRTALTTFTLEPRRWRVMMAKCLPPLATAVAASLFAMLVAVPVTAVAASVQHVPATWDVAPLALLGWTATNVLVVATALAVGMLLLNAPAAIVICLSTTALWNAVSRLGATGEVMAEWLSLDFTTRPLIAGDMTWRNRSTGRVDAALDRHTDGGRPHARDPQGRGMTMRRTLLRTLLSTVAGVLVTGCSAVDTSRVTADAVVPLDQAPLDAAGDHRVVGIGEATHGNKELVQARTMIIQQLVREHGFRTVALEADFGGAATANDYVMTGQGSAEDAAETLGFDIYRTREMVDLIEWIHDYNAVVADKEEVRVYGFDMQRYDLNKKRLLRYLATVDPARVGPVKESLADLTDATRSEQDKEKVTTAATAAERLVVQMKDNREKYVNISSQASFALALHHAETIQRGAQLQTSRKDYASKRDTWMAESIEWIADLESDEGREKIIVAGHNGHIEKSGAAFAHESMGQRLAKTYGNDYFTIGTDFGTSTFISKDADSGERKQFTVSHTSPLAMLFGDEPLGYVDIAQASSQPGNRQLLTSEVRMGSVGDRFRSIYTHLSWTYTVKMVPAKAYDALVYVPHAGPATPL